MSSNHETFMSIISCRTLVNFAIAVGHIVAFIWHLSNIRDYKTLVSCQVLGVLNEMALVASNLWYVMLAVDLLKAIRNPFRFI